MRELRDRKRRARFGDDAVCELCGETTLTQLEKIDRHVVCACCGAIARGREILEVHHVAGGGEGPTVRIDANCHRRLSELQRDWPPGLDFEERLSLGWQDINDLHTTTRSR